MKSYVRRMRPNTHLAVNMLTCSLVFFSSTNCCCNLWALSSAPSAWSCKDLIFRLTASSAAIVYCTAVRKAITLRAPIQLLRNWQPTRWRLWLWWKLREDGLNGAYALWRRTLQCLLFVQEVLMIWKWVWIFCISQGLDQSWISWILPHEPIN